MNELIDIKSMTCAELADYFEGMGEKKFRSKQLFDWMHVKLAAGYEEMTNLSATLKEKLSKDTTFTKLKVNREQISELDGTRKYAFTLDDGNIIESVFMKYNHGNSVCISSQAGCRMGCKFCASTIDGLARNLTASEMLEQIYEINRITGERISNVVIMGSGEPLDNYDNVLRFIKLITDEAGYNMSSRNITLSTCGLVPEIEKLAKEHLQVTLAISLHAPNDELRKQTMPIANKYSISEIMRACDRYFEETGRRVSFEYAVIQDFNSDDAVIDELIQLLHGKNCHVNLISVNPIKERSYERTQPVRMTEIKNKLEKSGINATIRRKLGADIDSACGQLRRRIINGND